MDKKPFYNPIPDLGSSGPQEADDVNPRRDPCPGGGVKRDLAH